MIIKKNWFLCVIHKNIKLYRLKKKHKVIEVYPNKNTKIMSVVFRVRSKHRLHTAMSTIAHMYHIRTKQCKYNLCCRRLLSNHPHIIQICNAQSEHTHPILSQFIDGRVQFLHCMATWDQLLHGAVVSHILCSVHILHDAHAKLERIRLAQAWWRAWAEQSFCDCLCASIWVHLM